MRPVNKLSKSLRARSSTSRGAPGQVLEYSSRTASRTAAGRLTWTVSVTSKSLRRQGLGTGRRAFLCGVSGVESTPRRGARTRWAAADMRGITTRDSIYVKCRRDRGVVGRPLPGPRRAVDRAGRAALGERRRGEHQVDAKAMVAAECVHAVVPPAPRVLRLVEAAEQVGEAERGDPRERFAFRDADVDGSFPRRRVVDVAVLGRDVEVPDDQQVFVSGELRREAGAQALEPGELVRVLLRADRLAVRHVDVHQPDRADGGRDHAPLRVGIRRHAAGDVEGDPARDDRDAVVGLLAVERRLQPERPELRAREVLVGELEFLQRDRVYRVVREPASEVLHPDPQRVDVPGGDAHGGQDRYAAGRMPIVRATTLYGNAWQRTFRTLTTLLYCSRRSSTRASSVSARSCSDLNARLVPNCG